MPYPGVALAGVREPAGSPLEGVGCQAPGALLAGAGALQRGPGHPQVVSNAPKYQVQRLRSRPRRSGGPTPGARWRREAGWRRRGWWQSWWRGEAGWLLGRLRSWNAASRPSSLLWSWGCLGLRRVAKFRWVGVRHWHCCIIGLLNLVRRRAELDESRLVRC